MNEKFFDLKKEKQDRIINAALKVFAQNGYRHSSTDVIVKEAAISKGLLFHYFGSKIGLFSFLFDYSVKYMLLEFSRSIPPQETNYFSIRKAIEGAKLNVLRNYPFMSQFIEQGLHETQLDVATSIESAKNSYLSAMRNFKARVKDTKFKAGLDKETLENLIRYTVNGLTADQLQTDSYQPEMLYEEISNYIELLRTLTEEK